LLAFIWGGSFYFNSIALQQLPPLTLVWGRVCLAAVTLWAFVILSGTPVPHDKRVWGAFIILGLFNNMIPFGLIAWGQTHISSALASILNATTPLFGVMVAHFFTRDEKMSMPRLMGVLLGFFGVVVMLGASFLSAFDGGFWGQMAVIGAALSYASASVYSRRFSVWGIKPMVAAMGQVSMSTLLLLPLVLFWDAPWRLPALHLSTFTAVVCLGVVSTAIAYILFFRIAFAAGATNITLVTFLIPVTAILLGVSLLNEELLLRHIMGFALIGVGLICIDGRIFSLFSTKA
jgi:drug/metabolite transporter (DMT)-like permease